MATESELRQKPVSYLKQYIGIKEGSTEHKAILAVFNNSKLCTRYTMTTSDAWCATGASAAFIASGLSSIFPCVECSCYYMISKAKTAGIWVENDAYVPKVGDCILYDWDDSGSGDNTGTPDHVGIIAEISGTSMKVIECNISDSVGYRSMTVNGKYIRGYITPKYSSLATTAESTNTSSSSSDSSSGSSSSGYTAGQSVTLKSVKLYSSSTTKTSSGTKTGTFFLWDGVVTNNRVKITNTKANVGKSGQVTGWINISDISGTTTSSSSSSSSSTSYAVGDKVTVNGKIYANGNGGKTITKSKATMYVVNLVSSKTYKYYIGVAATKGGTRQGWASPSILTKS